MDRIIDIATYAITVENDGDRTLGPIYVRDIFPPAAEFINASVRPAELTSTSANWTLTHLAIGDVSTITLRLDVTNCHGGELVNKVEACGEYNDKWICDTNFSALEIDWLTCCLNETVHVTKTAKVGENESNVVWYALTIRNLEDSTRVAQVTDTLPEGVVFLNASIPPSSYDEAVLTWNLIDMEPLGTVTIVYKTEALRSGTFVNRVQVDARSVDGPAAWPVFAKAVIDVGEFGEERPAPGWQPPDWFGGDTSCLSDLSCEELLMNTGSVL